MRRSIMREQKIRQLKSLLLKHFAIGTVILAALLFGLDYLFPPKLQRFEDCSMIMLDRNGQILNVMLAKDERWRLPVSLDEIDPFFIRLLIAFEDKRFYYHPGVDPLASARALIQMIKNGRVISGGSTLTLQTVRLLNPKPRTFFNKFREYIRALQLEMHFSKKQILEMYLRLAPFGGNLEGLRAATLAYFGKEPRNLRPAEAALLVALPQSPNHLRPDVNPSRAKLGRDKVLGRACQRGLLTEKIRKEALEEVLPLSKHPFPKMSPHLAFRLWQSLPHKNIHHTVLKLEIQRQLEEVLKNQIEFLGASQSIAVLIVENASAEILAYAGSVDFFDETKQGQVNMIEKIRSPGSLLKPFIYALGFEKGLISPESLISDVPSNFSGYAPSNFKDVFHGTVTIREALQHSLNVPAVIVLEKLNPSFFANHLRSFGIRLQFEHKGVMPALPLALGGVGMRLKDLVNLYHALAMQGEFKPLVIVKEPEQKPVKRRKPFLSREASNYITQILEGALAPEGFVDRQTSRLAALAYKTGTSYGYRDAWAIGYTPDYTIGIWIGRPDGTPCPHQTGRQNAAPLLFKIVDFLPSRGRDFPRLALENRVSQVTQLKSVAHPALKENRFQVIFPKTGSIISVVGEEKNWEPILVTVSGGKPPYYLFENDKPSLTTQHRTFAWHIQSLGFTELTIVDSNGNDVTLHLELQ